MRTAMPHFLAITTYYWDSAFPLLFNLLQEREKEADILWFMQRTNKAVNTGLASLTKAQGTFLRG